MKILYAYIQNCVRLFPFCIVFLCMHSSCSLNYGQASQVQILSPEFVFYDASFTRIERGRIKVKTKAGRLEQYTGIDAMYGQDVSFILYDDEETPSLEGSCFILAADREDKEYYFFSNIDIQSYEHRARITARSLRWDEQTEILSGAKNDTVHIFLETENGSHIELSGTGFFARKKDLSFYFSENVSGMLAEKNEEKNYESP